MTAILGLNSAGINTATTLLVDGVPIFAVEEERLIREKRTRRFPNKGIEAALRTANFEITDLDAIAIAWNPAINLEAFSQPQSQRARYLGEIFYSVPNHLMALGNLHAGALTEQVLHLENGSRLTIYYVRHHLAHASCFFASDFEEAAILTIDAFGEKDCVQFCHGRGSRIEPLWSQEFPHSLGSFYSAFTSFLGFKPQDDEWKVMGASSYGSAEAYYDRVRSLVALKENGFELDLSYFNHYQFHRPGLFTPKLAELLGVGPNPVDHPLSEPYFDLAAGVQRVFEDVYLHLANQIHERTKLKNLVLAGGSALNAVANGKIANQSPFSGIFIPPVPDDAGGSLGSALYVHNHVLGRPRGYVMTSNYLGPEYSDSEIGATLDSLGIAYQHVNDPAVTGARLIANGKIIGWLQGRLEFGDRALGNRSILADPRDPSMKDKVNARVKYREPFRPMAPAILAEHVEDFFENAVATPFMEKVFQIRPEKRALIPAVTHVDGSGRLQTVTRVQNPLFAQLILELHKLTGVPVVLNTSFNLKGEAMVCSPSDALRTFYSSGLDALVMGTYLVEK